jgi:hypothetical protein
MDEMAMELEGRRAEFLEARGERFKLFGAEPAR